MLTLILTVCAAQTGAGVRSVIWEEYTNLQPAASCTDQPSWGFTVRVKAYLGDVPKLQLLQIISWACRLLCKWAYEPQDPSGRAAGNLGCDAVQPPLSLGSGVL